MKQINKSNVKQLEVAWAYATGERGQYLFNPVVVDGVMYVLAKNNSVVRSDGTYHLNQESLDLPGLQSRLNSLFHGANQVIFLRGGKDLEFGKIAEVIDIARGAGVSRVALMTN